MQDQTFMEASGFGSAAAAKKVIKDLESLRNNLAHGQDVTSHDWPQIVRLARRVRQMYGARRTEGARIAQPGATKPRGLATP